MKIKTGSIISIIAVLAVLGLVIFLPVKKVFLAAVSNANVFVSGTQENNPPPIIPSGGGGYYYPTIITPIVPPTVPSPTTPEQPNIPKNLAPPTENTIAPAKNTHQPPSTASLLPFAVADLSAKIPEFASILSNLNVKTAQDVAGLQNYNIFLPPINPAEMPTDTVVAMLGKGNINALTKLDFSADAPSLEQINVLTA